MKAKVERSLTESELRELQQKLGVTLGQPTRVAMCPNQQFSVRDEDGVLVGDIMSRGQFFTYEELEQSIEWVINNPEDVSLYPY